MEDQPAAKDGEGQEAGGDGEDLRSSNIAFSCSRASPGQGPVEREATAPVCRHHRAQGHHEEVVLEAFLAGCGAPNQFMKNPFGTCVLMAPSMIPTTPSAAMRPPTPSRSANGASSSVVMASAARGAGKPRVFVIHVCVPVKP